MKFKDIEKLRQELVEMEGKVAVGNLSATEAIKMLIEVVYRILAYLEGLKR